MKVLVIASHPDDEVLGVGGTVFSLANEGYEIYFLIMTKGMVEVHGKEKVEFLRQEAIEVHKYLPSSGTFFEDFPSLNMDTIPKREINKCIERVVHRVKPDIVFTHYWDDVNSDHQIVFGASMVALRPYAAPFVKKIYCYEVMSATEWTIPSQGHMFVPICFNDITLYLDKKLHALSMYKSQEKDYPHTRSLRSVENHARQRGNLMGMDAAECFYPIRLKGI